MSVQCSVEGIIAPEWEVLERAGLRLFVERMQPFILPAGHWHPRQEDSVAHVAETTNIPLHITDQLYAQMLDTLKISEKLDDDSPWHTLNDVD